MIARISFLLALAFAGPARAEPLPLEKDTGVLRVSTEYEAGHASVGTGIVVFRKARKDGEKDRTFLFTCAHLTGGGNTKVSGVSLDSIAIGRRTDNFRDLDLIELDPKKLPVRPFARHTPPNEMATAYFREYEVPALKRDFGLTEAEAWSTFQGGNFYVDEKALAKWQAQPQSVLEVTGNEPKHHFVLMPPWSDRAEAEGFSKDRLTQMHYKSVDSRTGGLSGLNVTKTLSVTARIAPGMSCAPLISPYHVGGKKYLHTITGLGTEFRYQMASSTFSSTQLWLEALGAYLAGNTAEDVPAKWASHDGMLYLKIGEKSAEIIPAKPAGNGVTVDPGNGVTVDPGKGSPAKAVACDPLAIDPLTPWEKSSTKPGIVWEGKNTLGFSMEFAPGSRTLIFPDRAGIEFRLANEDVAGKVENVSLGTNVLPWLNDRYGTHSEHYRLKSGDMYTSLRSATIERHGKQLDVTLYGPAPASDEIQFSLNEYGALVSETGERANELNPLVEVKGKSGSVYIVDLTDLFFVQAKSLGGFFQGDVIFNPALGRAHPATVLERKRKSLQWKLGGAHFTRGLVPGLNFRKKCSADEIRLNFDTITPLLEEDTVCHATHLPYPIPEPYLKDVNYLLYKLMNSDSSKESQ